MRRYDITGTITIRGRKETVDDTVSASSESDAREKYIRQAKAFGKVTSVDIKVKQA